MKETTAGRKKDNRAGKEEGLTSKIKYDKSFSDALMNLVPVIEQNEEFLNVFQKIYVDLSKEIF